MKHTHRWVPVPGLEKFPQRLCRCGALWVRESKIGKNSITSSPGGVGDVIRWSGTQAPVAAGDLGMNVTTGRPAAFVGGASTPLAVATDAGWIFVSKSTVGAAVATVLVSGLNGNVDLVYRVLIRLIGTTGVSHRLDVRPNSVTTNLSGTTMHSNGTTLSQSGIGTEIPIMPSIVFARSTIDLQIHAQTGQKRLFSSRFGVSDAINFIGVGGGQWDETATNLTSLLFRASTGLAQIQPGTEIVVYRTRQS